MKDIDLQKVIDDSLLFSDSYLVLADFNVMLWKVLSFYDKNKYLFRREQNLNTLLKIGIAYIFNRGPAGLSKSQYSNSRVIAIADSRSKEFGGYWRHYEVARDPRIQQAWDNYKKGKQKLRAYKDGRGDKTELFHKAFGMAKEYCEKNLSYYEFYGFEADDIAGAIYRSLSTNKERTKIFYTLDRDWSQLVAEELGYYWYTPRISKPNEWMLDQAMDNSDVILYAEKKLDFSDLKHPSQLVEAKTIAGDLGDNLPPGSPKEYMCLINAHPRYDITKLFPDKFQSLIKDCAVDSPNVKLNHIDESLSIMKKMNIEFDFSG